MSKSQQSFAKKEREKKRQKKREEKAKRKAERAENNQKGAGLDSMIMYVDQYGRPTDVPPDQQNREEVAVEDIELGVPKVEHEEIDPIRKGRLGFFNSDKGYGFITDAADQEKYFVHFSNFEDDIIEGNNVQFELEKGDRGMVAVRVKKV